MRTHNLGIYIHVPFCKSKCPYCDFFSVIPKKENPSCMGDLASAVVKSIDSFFEERGSFLPIDTIYFGGGTPALLDAEDLSKILGKVLVSNFEIDYPGCIEEDNSDHEKWLSLSKKIEITIEANPKDISSEKLVELRKIGFNRLSLGFQSFDDEVLKKLGRRHRSADNAEVFNWAREAGFDNISIDLMFGIPGQNMDSWKMSVDSATELNPEHISLYSLEFMEGTAYTKMLEDGKISETDPEEDRTMYHTALETFEKAGFRQYEISNVAKPGFESRHNLKYWNLDEYAGFGPSAHSYIGHRRYSQVADIDMYIKNPTDKIIYEENTVFDDMSEFVFTGLRKTDGIDLNEFWEMFGMDIWAAFEFSKPMFMDFVKDGYAELTEDNMRLTLKGFDISNKILCLFV